MNRALKCQEIVVLTPCASKYYPETASALCAVQFFMHPRPGSCNSETMTLLLFVLVCVCVLHCECPLYVHSECKVNEECRNDIKN